LTTEPSIEDLVDAFEVAVKDAAYSDSHPMGDPGNHYKHMERDEALTTLMGAIIALRQQLTARDDLLREWLEAEETPYPYAEAGIEAQRAWSHRRHAARDAVRAILAKGDTKCL
jgi:hypothetical protein